MATAQTASDSHPTLPRASRSVLRRVTTEQCRLRVPNTHGCPHHFPERRPGREHGARVAPPREAVRNSTFRVYAVSQ